MFLYRIDNWINKGSGLIVELIESQYINVSTYRPWLGSSYIKLLVELKSPVQEKRFSNIEKKKKNICIKLFCYENKLTFPIYVSDQKFQNWMNFLLVIDEKKSDYLYIKDFNRFMFDKTNNKNKKVLLRKLFTAF